MEHKDCISLECICNQPVLMTGLLPWNELGYWVEEL